MKTKLMFKPVLIAMACAAIHCASTAFGAVVISQSATADALVRSGAEKKNFGAEQSLDLKPTTFGGTAEAYVRFDIPRGAGFSDKVKLRMYGRINSGATAKAVVRSVPGANWAEETLTWQVRPEHGTTLGELQVVGVSPVWYELDVTQQVRSQIAAGDANVSFAFVPGEGAKNGISFHSRESASHQPELVFSRPLFSAKVIFTPAKDAAPSGYIADHGEIFGSRGGGMVFGWSADNRGSVRDRTDSKYKKDKKPPVQTADRRYDFMAYMDGERMTNRVFWEIAVPPSTFKVRVVAGDSYRYDSIFGITAEKSMVVEGVPDSNKRWLEGAAVVSVTDGRLTIDNTPSSSNNKLCFIEIKEQETLVSRTP